MMKKRFRLLLSLLAALIISLACAFMVSAEEGDEASARVIISAENNIVSSGNTFIVTVTITTHPESSTDEDSYYEKQNGEMIGAYYLKLDYDNSRMSYISGAEEEKDGVLILKGTGLSDTIEYALNFRAIDGGEAGIAVEEAIVKQSEAAGAAALTVDTCDLYRIVVSGDASNKNAFTVTESETQKEISNGDIPAAGTISDDSSNIYYVVDLNNYSADKLGFSFDVVSETIDGESLPLASDKSGNAEILVLADDMGNISMYGAGNDGFYKVDKKTDSEGNTYFSLDIAGCKNIPEEIASADEAQDYVFYAINSDGTGSFCLLSDSNELISWDSYVENGSKAGTADQGDASGYSENEGSSQVSAAGRSTLKTILMIGAAVLLVGAIVFAVIAVVSYRRSKMTKQDRVTKVNAEDIE